MDPEQNMEDRKTREQQEGTAAKQAWFDWIFTACAPDAESALDIGHRLLDRCKCAFVKETSTGAVYAFGKTENTALLLERCGGKTENGKVWLMDTETAEQAALLIAKEFVKQDGTRLAEATAQTESMCFMAVSQNADALQFVKKQTPAVCLAAVMNNGYALYHVEKQTRSLCLAAVQQNGTALKYVKDKEPEVCMAAVKQCGLALEYVPEELRSPGLVSEALRQNGNAVRFLIDPAPETCMEAVRSTPTAIEFIDRQTEDLCMEAVRRDPQALAYIKNPSVETCTEAVRADASCLRYIKNPSVRMRAYLESKKNSCEKVPGPPGRKAVGNGRQIDTSSRHREVGNRHAGTPTGRKGRER